MLENLTAFISEHMWGQHPFETLHEGNIRKKKKPHFSQFFSDFLHFIFGHVFFNMLLEGSPSQKKKGGFFCGLWGEADSSPPERMPRLLAPTAAPCTRPAPTSPKHPSTGIKAGLQFSLEPKRTSFQSLDDLTNQRWKGVFPTTTTHSPKLRRANTTLRLTTSFAHVGNAIEAGTI